MRAQRSEASRLGAYRLAVDIELQIRQRGAPGEAASRQGCAIGVSTPVVDIDLVLGHRRWAAVAVARLGCAVSTPVVDIELVLGRRRWPAAAVARPAQGEPPLPNNLRVQK